MNGRQDKTFEIAVLKAATKEVVGYIGEPFPSSELEKLKSTITTWNLHHEVNVRFPNNFDSNLLVLPEPFR